MLDLWNEEEIFSLMTFDVCDLAVYIGHLIIRMAILCHSLYKYAHIASTFRFLWCLKAFWRKHWEKLQMPSLCSLRFSLRLCTQGFVCALRLTGASLIGRRREPGSLKSQVLITYWSNLADNSLKSGGQQGMPVKRNERARETEKERERERDWERERESEKERDNSPKGPPRLSSLTLTKCLRLIQGLYLSHVERTANCHLPLSPTISTPSLPPSWGSQSVHWISKALRRAVQIVL